MHRDASTSINAVVDNVAVKCPCTVHNLIVVIIILEVVSLGQTIGECLAWAINIAKLLTTDYTRRSRFYLLQMLLLAKAWGDPSTRAVASKHFSPRGKKPLYPGVGKFSVVAI